MEALPDLLVDVAHRSLTVHHTTTAIDDHAMAIILEADVLVLSPDPTVRVMTGTEHYASIIARALRPHWPDSGSEPDTNRQIHAAAQALTRHYNPAHPPLRQVTTIANALRPWWPHPAERGLHWTVLRTTAHHIVTALNQEHT